jgi:heme/copper-type cytochrome/quinol oxidase subunit 1
VAEARRSSAPHHVVPWQSGRVVRWLATTDHKQIGILMVVTALGFLLLTTALSLVVRSQLVVSEHTAVSRKLFAGLVTMNGTTLLFLVVLPLLLGLATYLVPLMIGAREMALPRITALAYWLYLFAAVFLTATWVSNDGPPRATFESLVPLANGDFSAGKPQTILGISMILLAVSWLLWSLNLLATVVARRADGMTWCRLPLFAWAATISAGVLVVATPVLVVATAFLVLDREAGTGILDGDGARSYEHLFWFFGQPAIGVMVILAAGIVSEIIPVFARRAIASRMPLVIAFAGIALSSLLSYGRHLAAADLATWAQSLFMIASLALVAFAGIAIVVWIATLWSGRLRATAAVMFSVGSIVLLTVGLLASVFLAAFPLSWQLSGTTYEAAQLHYVVEGGVLFAAFAGLFYWWPKMFGRVLDERLGKASYVLLFVGFNTLYIPQFMLGILGMPADAFTYANGDWNGYQQHSLVGAAILAVGIALLTVNIVRTSLTGTRVGRDPWSGDTLEWYAASPPVPHNFDSLPAIDSERPVRDARRRLEAAGDR